MSTHKTTGTVLESGATAGVEVWAYDQATGALLATANSNPVNGDYEILLDSADPVFVMPVPDSGFLPQMKGPIVPVAI